MFNNANGVVVTGGTFTTHLTNPAHNENQEGLCMSWMHTCDTYISTQGLKILQRNIASGAFHNSAERYDPPKCHPNTRIAILEKIMDWVNDLEKVALFLWMYGPAGAGKSAIAQTIAEMCYKAGILAASFFFSRNAPGRNNEVFLIATLVYQLTLAIPEIRERVGKALETDPLLFSRSLEAQLQALVVDPLNAAALEEHGVQTLRSRPTFIILDGLDECSGPKTQRYILDIFVGAITQLTVPLFLLVASRPEANIRDAFNEPFLSSSAIRIVLDDTYHPDADIRLFLKSRFQDVIRKHPRLQRVQPSWPSDVDIELLVQKSSGQFIYASTAMKYLDVFTHWPPDRLDVIFGLSTSRDGTPFSELDIFYDHILSSVSKVEKIIEILSFLLLVQFWNKTKMVVEDFLLLRRGEVDIVLSDIHSLVSVPTSDNESGELRIFHASLPDFLLDRSRSGRFYLDKGEASTKITRYCMIHFKLSSSLLTGANSSLHGIFSLTRISLQMASIFIIFVRCLWFNVSIPIRPLNYWMTYTTWICPLNLTSGLQIITSLECTIMTQKESLHSSCGFAIRSLPSSPYHYLSLTIHLYRGIQTARKIYLIITYQQSIAGFTASSTIIRMAIV